MLKCYQEKDQTINDEIVVRPTCAKKGSFYQLLCYQEKDQTNGVFLTVGIYAINTHDADVARIQQKIHEITSAKKGVLQTHGLYIDKEERIISFDILVDFAVDDPLTLRHDILQDIQRVLPDYHVSINIDRDVTD